MLETIIRCTTKSDYSSKQQKHKEAMNIDYSYKKNLDASDNHKEVIGCDPGLDIEYKRVLSNKQIKVYY